MARVKILHLIAGELSGGAARGAYWLHQAQREIGIDSRLLTNGRETHGDASVTSLGTTPVKRVQGALRTRLGNAPLYLYRKRRPWIFNTGFAGVDFTKHAEYRRADLIHLHWINGLVAMRTLRKVEKPIVWTMRDMWPMTGGCHVGAAFGCDRYKLGCGQCPQLGSKMAWDLSRLVVANKRASLPKRLRVVGISDWLTECASKSQVFNGYSVQTISNNVDTRSFCPTSPEIARQALGLPVDKRIVLVGALRVTEFYKGFDLFLEAMRGVLREDVHVLTFGRDAGPGLASLDVSHTNLGFMSDTLSLRLAYAAADVFVAPSLMDAFGKTLAEAMACGTPVVCFDATGPKDIVEHRVTGYKAVPFETKDLANGIQWVLNLPRERHDTLRRHARKRAVERFDSRVIASQYKALYEELLQAEVAPG